MSQAEVRQERLSSTNFAFSPWRNFKSNDSVKQRWLLSYSYTILVFVSCHVVGTMSLSYQLPHHDLLSTSFQLLKTEQRAQLLSFEIRGVQ